MNSLLTEHYSKKDFHTLKGYQKYGGYKILPKAFKMKPESIIKEVKDSGLRGRGGAGFPTGLKWSFLPKNSESRYLLCNADEGEPGTFKDRLMMEKAPHQLIEGIVISAYAISCHKGYIYIRGEYTDAYNILTKAIDEAYAANLLGRNILNTGFDFDLDMYRGAGAYICGEETGMISSLEGKKGQPKLKPPFPAVEGYLGKPTIVNNVETLAAVKYILKIGAKGFRKYGTEKSPGTKLFSVSGDINRPGNYEVPLGYPLMDLIEKECQGMREGRKLKACIPGGSSAPVLNYEECTRATMDFECLAEMGSMLGSGAVIILDETRCMVDLLKVTLHFYHHESCGQCTPCREGTGWLEKIVDGIMEGKGRLQDIDLLERMSDNMQNGRTICALSDAAAMPTIGFITKFRDEFDFFIKEGKSKAKKGLLDLDEDEQE